MGDPASAGALAELHTQICTCTACPLAKTRIQAVPGSGPVTARIMAVGEAPGGEEDKQGIPFVGAAGRLLTELVELIGMTRDDIYICNVLKCRPPGNRDPLPEEVDACAHFLDAQITLIKPEVILLLGRHAVARVLPGLPGISQIHGKKFVRGDRTYVPLYHPAAALYQGSLKSTLEDDMWLVKGYLDDLYAKPVLEPAPVTKASSQLPLF